ncbi:MAG TPA: hypothetical protein VFT30_01920 [Nitrospira sp.]|nr:hypothetical protein [Nitrospira sp.]
MNFQNSIDSGAIDSGSNDLSVFKPPTGTVSGTTGQICSRTGVYRSTDNKAQYLEVVAAGDPFPPFPGGKGTSKTTWTLMTSSNSGTAATTEDGGFRSVLVEAGTA